jgi:hypothetical protein
MGRAKAMIAPQSRHDEEPMNRKLWLGLIVGSLCGLALSGVLRVPEAKAQRKQEEHAWEYKVAPFSYNPGERLTDDQRAAFYQKTLNEQAREGWEPVGSVLSRDSVQTVGGAVTTRDTVSFVAYRRPRK